MSDLLDLQVAGLPLHILLVHVVVVGVPLLAVLLIVLAAWPSARRVLWLPVLIAAVLVLILTFATVEAGEWLLSRVPEAPLITQHAEQGEDVTPWVVGLVALAALVAGVAIAERRTPAPRDDGTSQERTAARRGGWRTAIAVLLVVASVGVGVGAIWTTIRVGEAGSRAVWEGSFSDDPLDGR
ncbi:hypothetical protein [Agromyces sp. SYSU T0242]|uniref:hypothetical protein n=1 Tax=Agromyces litoreus TaxID=3158561 RepID=UPI003396ACB3